MMDEATLELLSRSLDGDLDDHEGRQLQERISTDDEMRRELEALRTLRAAVADVARREVAPAALDDVVEALRRSRAPRPAVRPALRWLAAAAVVVLGTTVSLEVARQQRTPTEQPSRAPVTRRTPGAYYELQPLPTRAGPEQGELIGATDHLLASSDSEVELPPPDALMVIGPLSEEPGRGLYDQPPSMAKREGLSGVGAADEAGAAGAAREERRPPGESLAVDEAAAAAVRQAPAPPVARFKAVTRASPAGAKGRGVLEIDDAATGRIAFDPPSGVAPGVYTVVVEIREGRVVAASIDADDVTADHRRVAEQLVGIASANAANGVYSGRVIVP